MNTPFVIDNDQHRMSDVLNRLLDETKGKPFDIATAYFTVSGYRIVKDGLHKVSAFRPLIGSDPHTGQDVGLRPNDRKALEARLKGDLEAELFTPETLKLVEDLIAFLRAEKVELLSKQLESEKQLATLVENAYGLTSEERDLLRATHPIRDPLAVLERRIRGADNMAVELADGVE